MLYRAIGLVRHNGERYSPGNEIELTPEEADALILAGAIDPTPLPQKAQPVEPKKGRGKAIELEKDPDIEQEKSA